jgi:hypothetical protein
MESLELEISQWRSFVRQGPAIDDRDVEELEAHLRDQIAELNAAGLAADEAFLVAVKRMGRVDDLSREFAREHSRRLWRQLVLSDGDPDGEHSGSGRDVWKEPVLFAAAAAVTVQLARIIAFAGEDPRWFFRSAAVLVIVFLAGWFARRRQLPARESWFTVCAFAAAAIVINVFPYGDGSTTEVLAATHLPVVLWFVAAYPYMGGVWGSHERRMDFVRFTGEWCIYYVLIALGGGVLMVLTAAILEPTGIDPEWLAEWVLPSGAAGAVVIAGWLVESKQRVIENMAPVLTMLFTPLFAVMLTGAALVYAATAVGGDFDRELLVVFDALMVVVLGLVLYGISAREPSHTPGWMDRIQFVAVVSALVLDVMVLASMAARIGDLGLTPNRVAALGLNLVLLVNLAGAARLAARFLAGRGSFHQLERWQTGYLPVFFVWAAAVVVLLPPAFGFE